MVLHAIAGRTTQVCVVRYETNVDMVKSAVARAVGKVTMMIRHEVIEPTPHNWASIKITGLEKRPEEASAPRPINVCA